MKKLIFLSFIIFISFFTLNSQTYTSLGITGTYYDIRADNNNTIHIIWIDNGWTKYGQIVNRQVVNQVTISVTDRNEVIVDKFRPRLSVKSDGSEVHFVWVTPDAQSKDFMHCWKDSGGTWRKERIFKSTKYIEAPTFTVDQSGVYHASCFEWVSTSDLHPIVYYRKPVGGSWARQTNLASATAKHLWPNLFTDTNGRVHITWDKNKDYIQYRSTSSGGDLSASTTITLPNLHPHNKQSEVFADAAGNVHVAALSYNDGGTPGGIDYWVKPSGGSFLRSVKVSGPDFPLLNYFPFAAVIARSTDMVAVSWGQTNAPAIPATIGVAIYNGSWEIYYLSTTANFKANTRTTMAMDSESAYMVWREADQSLVLATFDYALFGVISPNGGEEWAYGQTYQIRWNLENATGDVDINLYKNNVDLGPIASDVADTGSFNWTINTLESGVNISNGDDYQIEVKAVNGSDSDMSNSFFTINTVFALTSPVSGDVWTAGQNYNITWTTPSEASSGVKINVFKDFIDVANFVEQLTGPNNGIYSWTIPGSFEEGIYRLRLKTDDDLMIDDSDEFYIEVDPNAPASITVNNPGAGATWYRDSSYNITWTGSGSQTTNVNIKVYLDSVSAENLTDQINTANDGSYNWTIPNTYADGNYIIRIETTDAAIHDDSGIFNITGNPNLPPSIIVTSPTSSSTWNQGSTYDITWNKTGTMSANVKINIFKDLINPANFVEQVTGPNTGSINWTIPGTYVNGNYIIRVKTDDSLVHGDSDLFTITDGGIVTPTITVNSPSAGVTWYKGSSYNITWTSTGSQTANVNIDIYHDSITAGNLTDQINTANDGSYNWTVPGVYADGSYVLRIETTDAAVHGDSGVFNITGNTNLPPSITVTSPTSSSTWNQGSTYDITWNKTGTMSANVKINIFKDLINPANFVEQVTGPNSGSINWTIPGTYVNGNYIIRVKTDDSLVHGDSDLFTITDGGIVTPTITVNSPSAGATWYKDQSYNITWSTTGTQTSNVNIDVYQDSVDPGNFIEQITTANDGSHNWTVPGVYADGSYVLRIETTDAAVHGDSGLFLITEYVSGPASITIISPNQCSAWSKNNTYTITWLKEGTMSANVKINIFKDYFNVANFVEQLTGPNTGSITWTIPGSYDDGNYILRIKTDDDLIIDDSKLFVVNSATVSQPGITVTSPTSCDTWSKLKTYKIAWSKAGTMSANVKVNIFKDSIDVANFVEQVTGPNTGSINWTIPGTYVNGNYIIRVKTDDSVVVGDSSLFAVTD